MTSSSLSARVGKAKALPKGTKKVSREVKAKLAELELIRKQVNSANKLANTLRKEILDEVGSEKNLTLIHNNSVVGSVSVEISKSVSKEKLVSMFPDVFEALAEESRRVTLDTK